MTGELERRQHEIEQRREALPVWARDAYDLLARSGQARRVEAATGRNALKLLEDLAPEVRTTVKRLMALADGTEMMDQVVAKSVAMALDVPTVARARYYRRLSGDDSSGSGRY